MKIQFSHANGFPGSCYNYLFQQMPEHNVTYVEKMGHGDYPLNNDLRNYAQELINDIEQRQSAPVVGMGHSAGAVVTLLAAAMRPDLFCHVILWDPVLFSKRKRYAIKLFKKLGLLDRISPAGRAAKRRADFASRDEAESYFAEKRLFKPFHPECFNDYIRHGLTETEAGVTLSISPEVEADVFRNVMLNAPKKLKQVKGTVIYGKNSDLFGRSDKKWWQRNFTNMEMISFPGGHLFPLEHPDETVQLVKQILDRVE